MHLDWSFNSVIRHDGNTKFKVHGEAVGRRDRTGPMSLFIFLPVALFFFLYTNTETKVSKMAVKCHW